MIYNPQYHTPGPQFEATHSPHGPVNLESIGRPPSKNTRQVYPVKRSKENRNRSKNEKRCYNCHPRGQVLRHFISDTRITRFSYDMWGRKGMILAIPKMHIENVTDMNPEVMAEFFADIDQFCMGYGFRGYQIKFNNGNWKSHHHFHIKIQADENIVERMREYHFERQKYERELHYDLNHGTEAL